MATAITPLANVTLSSNTSTVTFSSISGVYRDLMLVTNIGRASAGSVYVLANSNHGTGSVALNGSGSSVTPNNFGGIVYLSDSPTAGSPNTVNVTHFLDYSTTDKHKTVLTRNNDANTYGVTMESGRYGTTSAITSLTISALNMVAGSSFALYGVSA